ncbi:MAG: hypothetical protein LBH96_00975 [Candidatus Peribacteria bacterium]|nr:hypothetical protein [Candidatus Peribacteria bacterium]
MAKRRRRGRSTVKINKYNVGVTLIILGAIFFFSKIVAPEAPIFKFLSEYASIAFGEI